MSTNTALDQLKTRVEGHTEGPWEVEAGNEAWEVRAPEGSITWDDHGGEVFRNQADAELIAAAPKLLTALEAVEALAREAHWDLKQANEAHGIECHQMHAACLASLVLEAIEEALR